MSYGLKVRLTFSTKSLEDGIQELNYRGSDESLASTKANNLALEFRLDDLALVIKQKSLVDEVGDISWPQTLLICQAPKPRLELREIHALFFPPSELVAVTL